MKSPPDPTVGQEGFLSAVHQGGVVATSHSVSARGPNADILWHRPFDVSGNVEVFRLEMLHVVVELLQLALAVGSVVHKARE